jgi:hypothetical protein
MATSNSFINFGKKIYRTKPALLNNPSHLPALPHEYKFSQPTKSKGNKKKNARELRPKGGPGPGRGDFSLSTMPPHPKQKIRKIRNTGANFSAIGLFYTALRYKWTEGGPEGCALNEKK